MATFLFNEIIFGPVTSRRLGNSLGINLLPINKKICNFDCIYCECGWSARDKVGSLTFYPKEDIISSLEIKLSELAQKKEVIDSITFAGNGEPTLHPDFAEIIHQTILARNKYYPEANISVLSNGTKIREIPVFNALNKVDMNILKLDAGTTETCQLINQPGIYFNLEAHITNLRRFEGNLIIQSLFIQGEYKGKHIDNTTEKELTLWLKHIENIQPKMVMIYTIHRDTPSESLRKVPIEILNDIAQKVQALGIETQVSG